MRISQKHHPTLSLANLKKLKRVDPRPDYQRPAVWTLRQKQLLIDTILRDYDIPKMYWQRLPDTSEFEFGVIDGQQRLLAIWDFCEDKFSLPKDADPVNGVPIANLRYSDLPTELLTHFDSYTLDITIVEDAIQNDTEDEVRDMFLRFQSGTTLKAQEKRNAMLGQMRDFVKDISKHKFFKQCGFSDLRYTFDHVAAQLICIEIQGGPTNVRDGDLNRLYHAHKRFNGKGRYARKIRKVLNYLLRAFPNKTEELQRYNVIALYCLVSELIETSVHDGTEDMLRDWFLAFEEERRNNQELEDDSRDSQLIEYHRLTSQNTDSAASVRYRVETMTRRFFLACPDIEPLDNNRTFTHQQRLAIYRRDHGRCQLKMKCNGDLVPQNAWHADHIVPHAKGGRTRVSNGQVACVACNLAKGKKT